MYGYSGKRALYWKYYDAMNIGASIPYYIHKNKRLKKKMSAYVWLASNELHFLLIFFYLLSFADRIFDAKSEPSLRQYKNSAFYAIYIDLLWTDCEHMIK